MINWNISTIRLLNSSILVGVSGGLRLYLAFLLAGITPILPLVVASALIIYATYTLDRSLESKEDDINHQELADANKMTGLVVSGIAITIGIALFFSKFLFIPPLFPFIVGILYSRGITLKKREFKLKGGLGMKNLVIGITWGGTIGLIIASTGHALAALVICLFFGMKLFINSTIFDLKDVKGDLAAGIQTLPVVLGEQKLKWILLSLCVIQHIILALAIAWGILIPITFFLLYSFFSEGLVIISYSPAFESANSWLQRKFRSIMIDGESMIQVILSIFLPC